MPSALDMAHMRVLLDKEALRDALHDICERGKAEDLKEVVEAWHQHMGVDEKHKITTLRRKLTKHTPVHSAILSWYGICCVNVTCTRVILDLVAAATWGSYASCWR
jgi:hypothetical protein